MAAAAAVLVTGIPGAGKTTVSRALAERFPRGAHVEADASTASSHQAQVRWIVQTGCACGR